MTSIIELISGQTSNYVTELIKNHFLPKIIKYVNEREEDTPVSIEELEHLLSLPVIKTHYIKQSNLTNKKCVWIFKRGQHNGNRCDKPTIEGSDYCTNCSKRPCFKKKPNPEVVSNVITSDLLPKSGSAIPQVDVIIFNKEKELYLDEIHNYIFKKIHLDDGICNSILIGKLDDSDDQRITRLSNEEVQQATFDGHIVDEDYDLTDLYN